MGVASAIVLSNIGAAWGTALCARGLCYFAIRKPNEIVRNIIPTVMAGVQGIYGLIVSIILIQSISKSYSDYKGFAHFASGLSVGFCGLAGGIAIGVSGDYGTKSNALQPALFVPNLIVVSFASALGLYGLIAAMILSQV